MLVMLDQVCMRHKTLTMVKLLQSVVSKQSSIIRIQVQELIMLILMPLKTLQGLMQLEERKETLSLAAKAT